MSIRPRTRNEGPEGQIECPACGSGTHDGWTNRDGCPEDWTYYTGFQARRQIQLAAERVLSAERKH